MSPRTKIPLPFTAGLDRASGQEIVSPRAMADARNVYARSASTLALRPGMAPTPYPGVAWGTDVIGAQQMKGTKDIVVVVYDRVSRQLRLYRVNPIAAPTTQAVQITPAIPATPAVPALVGSTTGGTLAAGTYYYKVTALNAVGESLGSAEANVTTTGATSSVAVTITAVPSATSYRIYRGTAAGAENTYYTSAAVSFTDTGAAGTAGSPPVTVSSLVWGTLNASASFPHATFAEQAGRLFIAHDEPLLTYRQPTIYYTPDPIDVNVGTAATLTATLDSITLGAVLFRGVVAHADALWGWGYGTASDPDRSEIVHVSDSGDPLTFRPEGYFLCGAKGDAVLACAQAGTILAVRKLSSGYRITGSGADTYAIAPADALFGVEAPRLVISVGSDAFVWTAAGARKVLPDGSSVDMALPLDLFGPSPATLQAMGLTKDGFAVYDPNTRVLEFCFPDLTAVPGKTRCYACSLVNPQSPQWTYYERQVTAACAALIDPVKGAPAAVTAYASAVSVTDGGIQAGNAYRQLTISFTQNAQAGDEQWQVFIRRQSTLTPALSYVLATTIAATTGTTLTATVLNIPALAPYDVAIRATRAGAVMAGYASSDPAQWTGATVAGAKASGNSSAATPSITSALWQRNSPTTGQINVVFTLADTTVPVLMQQSPDGVTWTTVTTLLNGERSYGFPISGATIGTTQHFRAWPSRTENGVTVNGTPSADTPAICGFNGTPTVLDQWYSYNATWPASVLGVMCWMQHAPNATLCEIQLSPDGVTWTTAFSGAASPGGYDRFDANRFPGGITVSGMTTPAFMRARDGISGSGGATDFGAYTASIPLAAYNNTIPPSSPTITADVPAFVAPRSASDTVAGIAATPGSRVIALFAGPGPVFVAFQRWTVDGSKQTPLPTSVSGALVSVATLTITPGNADNTYLSFNQGTSP